MTETTHERSAEPPMVSVVIPTRDRRQALEKCLKALAEQTYPDYEVVVVDDGSSDGTPQFVQRFASDHSGMRLRCLENDTHIGANRSRNRGIGVAEGRFVAFIDSDCVAEPDWLEELARGFDSQCVAAVTGTVRNPPPANIYELTYRGTNRVHGSPYVTRLVGCNMGIRRDLLMQYPLDED
ncbi:MAG: glycosyltransferase family 2 protein, partial [Phycisphaerales bacterium]